MHNRLDPLRRICKRAKRRNVIAIDPTHDLELHRPNGRRERIADPAEAAALISALPESERALWAAAFYTGLRNGELRALRWRDVNLDAGTLRVERSWDEEAGDIDCKSEAGERTVPILKVLRPYLVAQKLATGRDGDDFVFGRTARDVYVKTTPNARAYRAWDAAGLKRITLHECRHTFATTLIHSGANAKVIQVAMGHSTIQMTFDIYGHLMPGGLQDAADMADAYLAVTLSR